MPEIGWELLSPEEEVLACAEIAWPDQRTAILPANEEHNPLPGYEQWTLLFWEPEHPFPNLELGEPS